jgi:TRAP-type mannitol/chloroaromatic compound transport system permease large subunit
MSADLAPTAGLWMLLALAVLVVGTGLPVWMLLLGCASAAASVGWALGLMDVNILSAVSVRTLGLLEHDLLQALPLYVFVGVLLQRLAVADAVFALLERLLWRLGARTSLAAMGVGALVAPMNGSVASSASLLARLVSPKLDRLRGPAATALVSVSATIGVVVPPSLVLILLGDAMMRAHIEASNLPGYVLKQRIINTQDVFHAALLPALAVLLGWLLITAFQSRNKGAALPRPSLPAGQVLLGLVTIAGVLTLLLSVFLGKLYAVEAAATGAMVLIVGTVVSRSLSVSAWRAVLVDTLSLSGALVALLVGATTFSLVFRLWGTDQWLVTHILASPYSALVTAAAVLALVGLCAWVLDAFEMIFVIIPIVAPALVVCLGDAQHAAVLLLLVLQLSFLLPPMGYAVMMARSHPSFGHPSVLTTLRALRPYLLAQLTITLAVFLMPQAVHWLDAPEAPVAASGTPSAAQSDEDIEQQMRDMAPPDEERKP